MIKSLFPSIETNTRNYDPLWSGVELTTVRWLIGFGNTFHWKL